MSTTVLTTGGQITLPEEVRKPLGLTAGTEVSFSRNEEGEIVVAVRVQGYRRYVGVFASPAVPPDASRTEARIIRAAVAAL